MRLCTYFLYWNLFHLPQFLNLSPLLQKSAWSLFYKHNCTGFARPVGLSSLCPKYLLNHSGKLFWKLIWPPLTTGPSHFWPTRPTQPKPTKPDQDATRMCKGLNAHQSANGPSVTYIRDEIQSKIQSWIRSKIWSDQSHFCSVDQNFGQGKFPFFSAHQRCY